MDPNIGKATIGKERTVAEYKESLPTSCGPHRNRFLEVQAEIRAPATKKLSLQKRMQQTEGHGWGRFVGGTLMGVSRRISGQ